MYAVVRTGGKQYRVAPGDILEVEKIDGAVGDIITLDDVLMVADGSQVTIGQPTVAGATVTAKITGQHRGEKILVFRYRPKKRIRVRKGHRQYLTRLQIESINGKTGRPATVEEAVPVAEAAAEAAVESEEIQAAVVEVEAAEEDVEPVAGVPENEEKGLEAAQAAGESAEPVEAAELGADDDSADDDSADDDGANGDNADGESAGGEGADDGEGDV